MAMAGGDIKQPVGGKDKASSKKSSTSGDGASSSSSSSGGGKAAAVAGNSLLGAKGGQLECSSDDPNLQVLLFLPSPPPFLSLASRKP